MNKSPSGGGYTIQCLWGLIKINGVEIPAAMDLPVCINPYPPLG